MDSRFNVVIVLCAVLTAFAIGGWRIATPEGAAPARCELQDAQISQESWADGTVVAVSPRLRRVWAVFDNTVQSVALPKGKVASVGQRWIPSVPLKSRSWPGDLQLEGSAQWLAAAPWSNDAAEPLLQVVGRMQRRRDEGNEWYLFTTDQRFLMQNARWTGSDGQCVIVRIPNHRWALPTPTSLRLGHDDWMQPYILD